MSTNKEIFPRRKPVTDPPLVCGELVNGRPTPTYALAWICSSRQFYLNLGGGELGKVDDCNFADVVTEKSHECPKFHRWLPSLTVSADSVISTSPGLEPILYPGINGNFYLIAMFNERNTDHLKRVGNLAEDPLIQSAKISMGVDVDPTLDETLQWIRWSPRRVSARRGRTTTRKNKRAWGTGRAGSVGENQDQRHSRDWGVQERREKKNIDVPAIMPNAPRRCAPQCRPQSAHRAH
ncbi:hypothetical protein B0H14DRAFT_3730082 [Mycena olivaceomarginata]|nr:hypothetical protein B0H14DRAFT_3730082 [Mycena olivaceomarginata]